MLPVLGQLTFHGKSKVEQMLKEGIKSKGRKFTSSNPFTVHDNHELLLLHRERERERKHFLKDSYQALCVWDKDTANRFSRAGVI